MMFVIGADETDAPHTKLCVALVHVVPRTDANKVASPDAKKAAAPPPPRRGGRGSYNEYISDRSMDRKYHHQIII